jgi:(1->4)-alpha-D-glucan 1-alpha-D-glucosylmutase
VLTIPTIPTATYRLQLTAEFGFADAGAVLDYLAALGISHLYLSPVLAAVPGSTHGYDVVDHDTVSTELGGAEAFHALAKAARERGLGIVVDIVPNHMAVPTPESLNAPLWSVLRDGPASPYANWFDVDWTVPDRAMLMPFLGRRIGECLDAGDIVLDTAGDEPVVRYFDHVVPVRPGTEHLPLEQLLDRQWYRLAYWRVADEELNYRRFFDIDTLAALRVENADVFAQSHYLIGALVREGHIAGLRVDHPDGLADPVEYLTRLQNLTGGCWVVVEKILTGAELLPDDWPCAGTTGYDALRRVGGLFVDPDGFAELVELNSQFTGEDIEFTGVAAAAKWQIVTTSLWAEVVRLGGLAAEICHDNLRLRDHTRRGLEEAITELLIGCEVYRTYVVPGHPAPDGAVAVLDSAAAVAKSRLPEERHDTVDLIREFALYAPPGDRRRHEFVVRFQQTSGPVMAKGVEDTAFYRWFPLSSANEVGGEPDSPVVDPATFHSYAAAMCRSWPAAMTTLSTHDTKRGEDVRARLAVLAELPESWARAVEGWQRAAAGYHSAAGPDPATEYLIWQTLVGAWPLAADRLVEYLHKATREAKLHTSWTAPDIAYDEAVERFARAVLDNARLVADITEFVEELGPAARVVTLSQKLVQLTMPGVPDVYQGTEFATFTLVDPDNRHPVDFAARRARLAALDEGESPRDLHDEKLLVTSRALAVRKDHPEAFAGDYRELSATSQHAFGFVRGTDVISVVTRLPRGLFGAGGWREHTVDLPSGAWLDVLTNRQYASGPHAAAKLFDPYPVALLVRA